MIQMNGFITPSHLCLDGIQFTAAGYSLFVDKGLGPMLDSYYDKLRLPKSVRNAKANMSKSAKRRKRAAEKKAKASLDS